MSATTRDEEVPPGEETPLLPPTLQKSSTPVPWAQVWILLVLQLAEPLTSQVIYPFAPEVCPLFLQTQFQFFSFILCLQFVRNVGITHGDESRVGYYVGMLVRFEVTVVLCLPCLLALSSNLYSSSLRPLRSYIGARSLISSTVSQSSSSDCSAYRYRCSDVDSRLPIGALLYGTYPFLKIGHLIHFS